MSIEDIINEHCQNGELYCVEPSITTDPVARLLYVTPEIHSMLVGPWKNEKEEIEWSKVKAYMDSFVSGDLLSVGTKKRRFQMTHLAPYKEGVWDIRPPGIRILGQFAGQDLFIGLSWEYRSDLAELFQWPRAIRKCKAHWRTYFHTYQPILSENSHDYITNIILS